MRASRRILMATQTTDGFASSRLSRLYEDSRSSWTETHQNIKA
jgi:hypothetical protein